MKIVLVVAAIAFTLALAAVALAQAAQAPADYQVVSPGSAAARFPRSAEVTGGTGFPVNALAIF